METLYCPKCDEQKEFYTELKSNQNTARCITCNTFIKNVPYQKPALYVGKYKGKPIDEIDDLGYLQWAAKTLSVNSRTKEALTTRISQLEFLAK